MTQFDSLRWRHNGRDNVSNHQPNDCLLDRLFRRRSKKTSKLRVTGVCAGDSPGTGEFPAQMASNAENVSIWWRHHVQLAFKLLPMHGEMLSCVLHTTKIIIYACMYIYIYMYMHLRVGSMSDRCRSDGYSKYIIWQHWFISCSQTIQTPWHTCT